MSKIKDFVNSLSVRQIVFSLITIISLLIFAVLTIWAENKTKGLADQQAALRWDSEGKYAQVTGFFSRDVKLDEFMIRSYEKQLEGALQEAGALSANTSNTEAEGGEGEKNADARLYVDAYSSLGKIDIESEKGKLSANAVGIGGDFFIFHPVQMVSGGYFSGNDLMKDWIILDEDGAWQLFGSNDIEGKSVWIGNIPHYVAGVFKRESGRMAENAGLGSALVYLSNESLQKYGTSEGINTYEVLAPNPVKGFLANNMREKFGISEGGDKNERQMLVVDNTARYSLEALIPVVLDFGTRSMQNYSIHYPYWENIARGFEDIRAVTLVFQFLFLLIPTVIIIVFLIIKWKNRSFTWRDAGNKLVSIKDSAVSKIRGEKKKWEHF